MRDDENEEQSDVSANRWVRAYRSSQLCDDFIPERVRWYDDEIKELDWSYDLQDPLSGSAFKLDKCFSANRIFVSMLYPEDTVDNIVRVMGRIDLPENYNASEISFSVQLMNIDESFTEVETVPVSVDDYNISRQNDPNNPALLVEINIGKYMRESFSLPNMSESRMILVRTNYSGMQIDAIEMLDITPAFDDGGSQDEIDDTEALLIIRSMLADVVNGQTLIKSMLSDLTITMDKTSTAVTNQSKAVTALQGDTSKCLQGITTLKTAVSNVDSKCALLDTVITNTNLLSVNVNDTSVALSKIDRNIDDMIDVIKAIDIPVQDTSGKTSTSDNSWKQQVLICVAACISVIVSNLISCSKNRSS